ncbi:MAG: Holliday junction resolvase RuvX [Tepidiformaceae bacterium]
MSDEIGLYAHSRPAIRATSRHELVDAVAALAVAEHITEVVVGLPLSLSGDDSGQTATVRGLVSALRERLDLPVLAWDERLSSVQAGRGSVEMGRGADGSPIRDAAGGVARGAKRRRSGEMDSAAARIILQAVLDSRRGTVPR